MQGEDRLTMVQLQKLRHILKGYGSVAVAFSGGVDSTFLLYMAHEVLGEKAAAVTALSCSFPERERREAAEFCKQRGIRQFVFTSGEMNVEAYRKNPHNRCYYCKTQLFTDVRRIAAENGFAEVAEGSNLDDMGDYRPGLMAVRELGIRSPLREAGMTKADIRAYSREFGLPTWDKPSYACLASRLPYGEVITEEKLGMIERAEQMLFDLGFRQMRVRMQDKTARIEVPQEQFLKLIGLREQIVPAYKALGFTYISMDLQGYRTGSMNEILQNK